MGSMNNLYESVENIDVQLFHAEACKKNGAKAQRKSLKLETIKDEPSVYFLCNSQNCTLFVAVENPMGRSILGRQHCYASYSGVFVKGMTQLLVTDELHVMPPSTKASLSFTFRCMSHGCNADPDKLHIEDFDQAMLINPKLSFEFSYQNNAIGIKSIWHSFESLLTLMDPTSSTTKAARGGFMSSRTLLYSN
ncbi:hypothetical protein WN943_026651 [Citrus x changshan-huyou]